MSSLGKPGVILGSYFWLVHISGWWRGPSSGIVRWRHPSMAPLRSRNPGLEDPMPRTIQTWDRKHLRLPLPDGVALWSCSKKGEHRIWGAWATPLPTASSYWTCTTLRCDQLLNYVDQRSSRSRGRKADRHHRFIDVHKSQHTVRCGRLDHPLEISILRAEGAAFYPL